MADAPAPFAKLFDTPDGQLLAYMGQTDEYEPAVIVIAAEVNGVVPSATLSGWTSGYSSGLPARSTHRSAGSRCCGRRSFLGDQRTRQEWPLVS